MNLVIDPFASTLIDRAAAIARAEGGAEVSLGHVLRALFFRPVTPALLHHLLQGSALADESASSAVSDVHVLLAILEDEISIGGQVLSQHSDIPSLRDELLLQIQSFDLTREPDHE